MARVLIRSFAVVGHQAEEEDSPASYFRHKNSSVALWLDKWHKPAWVDSRPKMWDAGMKGPPECIPTSVRGAFGNSAAHDDMKICKKLCEDGQIGEAVDELTLLVQRGCHVPNNLFYRALKRCTAQKNLILGRRIHALTITSGYEGDAFLATHLIGLYASCGRLDEAMHVFTAVSSPDAYNWAIIIFAHTRHGEAAQAIGLYRQMREVNVKPDSHVYIAVLKACANVGDLAAGKDVHAHIIASAEKPGIVVQNCLVDMYAKCGSIKDARRVFDEMPERVEVTWNTMITGYAQQGMGQEALGLYQSMQQQGRTQPGYVTFVGVLQACAAVGAGALHHGKQLHAQIKERGLQDDVVLGCSLVNMYAKCGSLGDARQVFDRLKHKNVVTWTALIAGYAQQGMGEKALSLYSSMQQEGMASPNSVTFTCLLQACACVGALALQQGKQLHAQIEQRALEDDPVVGGSLVDMYAKCGNIVDARRVFDRLPHRNVAAWNAMIAGYAHQELGQEAFALYNIMQQEGITPDALTFLGLLQVCATLAALPLAKHLHVQIEQRGLQADMVVGAALVNMYAKCGSMVDTQQVFDSLPARSIEAWGALVAGYTHQGDSEAVFELLERMRLEGMQPNGIIFLSVLTVCSHVGLVDKGKQYFRAMLTEYCVNPTIEHYTCLMDLLGRAGHLDEALQMAKTMPFPADGAVWVTLLGACQKWNNVEIGRQAFEFALLSLYKNDAPYILMSNI